MIDEKSFTTSIVLLQASLPYAKQLSTEGIVLLWDTFPRHAKMNMTEEILKFAVTQRMLDPDPPKEIALHLSLLRYVYPLENNRAAIQFGLRNDLHERMNAPDIFHDPQPIREEKRSAQEIRRLSAGSYWNHGMMSEEERIRHIEIIRRQVEELDIDISTDSLTIANLAKGRELFTIALKGYWTTKADVIRGWIMRNKKEALQLIDQALGGSQYNNKEKVILGQCTSIDSVDAILTQAMPDGVKWVSVGAGIGDVEEW